MKTVDELLLSRVRAAAEVIAPLAVRIENERRLPTEAVHALVAAGIFKIAVPRSIGGAEASSRTFVSAVETIAQADGSAGWCAMIAATSSLMSTLVDAETAREIYGPEDATTCGVFAPLGTAKKVDGGYRVSGRWPFASGCEHAKWRMGGTIAEGDAPLASGAPDVRNVIFPAENTTIHDTWDVSGLRGTGSHDFSVDDVFVPTSRTLSFFTTKPRVEPGGYALPFFGVLAAAIGGVSLGIARSALDTFEALAGKKTPLGARKSIGHRELVQLDVARAEARLRSARAFLFETLDAGDDESKTNGEVSLRTRALIRAAASHATTEGAAIVDIAYNGGGATSVYAKNPLQRAFRDVHVATQHLMVSPINTILAGRVLLGIDGDVSTL